MALDLHDPAERLRWHGMLTFIAAEGGCKPGWAGYKFKEKFGLWPAERSVLPLKPTPECLSWVRSRQIAYAKSKRRQA